MTYGTCEAKLFPCAIFLADKQWGPPLSIEA